MLQAWFDCVCLWVVITSQDIVTYRANGLEWLKYITFTILNNNIDNKYINFPQATSLSDSIQMIMTNDSKVQINSNYRMFNYNISFKPIIIQ